MLKKDIVGYLFSAILVLLMILLSVYGWGKRTSLKENLEFTETVISSFSSGPGGRYYLDYKFYVDEKLFQGSGKHYRRSDTLSIGDTILIVYDKTNPNNNKPYRDY
jgi:hypothetical protein